MVTSPLVQIKNLVVPERIRLMKKDVILWTREGLVYVKLSEDYMLLIGDEELVLKLPARVLVLLIDQLIIEHLKNSKPS